MGEVLSVNIIWIIKNDRPNRPLSWPSRCLPSDAGEMLIAVNHGSAEDWGTRAAVNPDPRCWSEIDNNLEIPAEFQQASGAPSPKETLPLHVLSVSLWLCWVGNREPGLIPNRNTGTKCLYFSGVINIQLLTYSNISHFHLTFFSYLKTEIKKS